MNSIKYTLIKTEKQYFGYCKTLEELVFQDNDDLDDEIELLSLLIEKWDEEHNTFESLDPIELIKALLDENNLKPKDLVKILGLSKGTVSKILNYHKGLSKESIRKLSRYFKLSQEAFSRLYQMNNQVTADLRNAS